ncbi:hypothetical protein P4637_20625 [Halalkalibacterium halodurans]|uniref:BH0766 protein n=1 Tax=Halalkalibacterium halodurans (strain ATCC BAA-125 / DSM 18197 / FERM 7344 / JCM 9153 / C-125) TaxID=272558 RepID=Q9KET3_HALH5|nr:hypothetical protein [Halalkalibacterium halodurans]MED4082838.1 hypothetical protein [Halalkalibacterium halodurans]MED4087220.1 hypothetical protein [Halalkalibacterium halodurans]MED4106831.1 hypothetical protein [Halalkalibacterium halodurans]MED4111250.1 hypothetical protein [Halalkalibacterium halodurans]MED4122904.1 hypothetical protein [Halalkalibacterium halodurans]
MRSMKVIIILLVVTAVTSIGLFIYSIYASNKELEAEVIEYLVNEKKIEEDDILASHVYITKGANDVAIYYAFDRDHIYFYLKSKVDGQIVESGKREVDPNTDSWMIHLLE